MRLSFRSGGLGEGAVRVDMYHLSRGSLLEGVQGGNDVRDILTDVIMLEVLDVRERVEEG